MARTWQRADKSDFTIVNEGNNVYRADEVVEQPKSEIKPEQPKVGELKAEQPKVGEPKVEQPKAEVKPETPKQTSKSSSQPAITTGIHSQQERTLHQLKQVKKDL